ncbi:uncharacterized protein LOC128232961 isoform X2 [Mya arenaria]|uniref:uncharacterized protein LOC128232961 isoform X2 n=1 Tax=Mya arenaria TaxID=6604 RepID=UPI0022E60AA2|nr:uncharacterized protein LOC128232961 isoform X2 [Mya arenaria]
MARYLGHVLWRRALLPLLNNSHATSNLIKKSIYTKSTRVKSHESAGEVNARRANDVCEALMIGDGHANETNARHKRKFTNLVVRWSRDRDVMFCPIYKIASTFWRRVFMINNERKDKSISKLTNPFTLLPDKEFPTSNIRSVNELVSNSYKFMFTRDPYTRLFSFYFDKLVAPVPYYWKTVGKEILKNRPGRANKAKCGHDITFPEFIQYVIKTLKNGKSDPHWSRMETLCNPCEIKYNFTGKLENFLPDSFEMTKKLKMNTMAEYLYVNGSASYSDDAILDKVRQPFTFKRHYTPCIHFQEAVSRTWKTLQIRGMIGDDSPPKDIGERSSWKELFESAKRSKVESTKETRMKMKKDNYRKYWAEISISDIEELRHLYARDFKIFWYNDTPEDVFQRRS